MSEAVRAAQEKLLELRRSAGIQTRGRITNDELRITNEDGESEQWAVNSDQSTVNSGRWSVVGRRSSAVAPNSYPVSRISYFSEPLSLHLRAAAARRSRQQAADSRDWLHQIRDTRFEIRDSIERGGSPAPLPPFPPSQITNDELRVTNEESAPNSYLVSRISNLIKVFPDIALAMLRTKTAAAGRVWLLLRHADADGRGRVAVDDAVRLLTGDGSALRICGRRQLGNLLRAGDGLFWERDTDRSGSQWLRLRSAARVAAGLGVARLSGSPVAVPLDALTGTIGQARAHLYAAFHSGRTSADLLTGERRARGPISRTTLCKLSGAAANSQRNYERRARVGRRTAIAIGPLAAAADAQETAWERGRAMFRYRDARGRYGRPGAVYLAWQLPNEYTGPHATLPRGRRKRLNRSLADLFHNGMTGNGGEVMNDECRMTNEEACGGEEVRGGKGEGEKGRKGEVNARTPGRQDAKSTCVSAPLRLFVNLWPSSVVRRRFYNSAKAAHLARGDGERYWRHGGVWLWQPEIRDTKYEIRVKRADQVLAAAITPAPLPPFPPSPLQDS